MDIVDSITKQIISEGDQVVFMLMVNSRSENNRVALMARPNDQYKLISLPIEGTWTGPGFSPLDANPLGVRLLAEMLNKDPDTSLPEVIRSLWDSANRTIETPGWNCSNMQEFSVFVTHRKTLKTMAEVSSIKRHVPLLDAEEHLQKALPFRDALVEHLKAKRPDLSGYEYKDFVEEEDRLQRIAMLNSCRDYDEDYDVPLPYAAYALNTSSSSVFAYRLIKTFRSLMPKLLGEDKGLYSEFYRAVHLGTAITHALSYLDIPLTPSHPAQSMRRDTAKQEFMSKILIEELQSHCSQAADYEDNPAESVRVLLDPLKKCVASLSRLHYNLDASSKEH